MGVAETGAGLERNGRIESTKRTSDAAFALMPRRLAAVVLAGVAATALAGCGREPAVRVEGQRPAPTIRVRLDVPEGGVRVAVSDKYQVYDLQTRRLADAGLELSTRGIAASEGRVLLGGRSLDSGRVVLVPRKSGAVALLVPKQGGRAEEIRHYHGNLRFFADGGKLTVVNVLDIERYLVSVVGKELPRRWHMECLKAQAIAARSYALYQMQTAGRGRAFDVYDSQRSQVYGGAGAETAGAREAVEATRGVVLAYRGRIIEAFFHSTCGGHTVPVEEYWPKAEPIAPLGGVPCAYCRWSPHYRWRVSVGLSDLVRRLRELGELSGLSGRITALEVGEDDRTPDGRVRRVTVISGDGTKRAIPLSALKACLRERGKRLKSGRFDVSVSPGEIHLDGRGFGHGVGMCQYGAEGQARMGRRAEGILQFYYPESRLARVY